MDHGDRETEAPRERRRFPGISARTWEHPTDRSALAALRRINGFDQAFRAMSSLLPGRSLDLLFLADAVRVGDRQFPRLDTALRDACYVLDLDPVPALYVTQDPNPKAMCVGLDGPVIVVTTGLVELLDDREMRTALGREVGHALSGHAAHRTLLLFVTGLATKITWLPLGSVATSSVVTGLRGWFRNSELSADRAGLLVGQDPQVSLAVLMKLAGGDHLDEMDQDAFLEQADAYERAGDLRDSVVKIMNVLPRSHPFTVVRAAELRRWAAGDEYRRILEGHYPRRENDDLSVADALRQSAERGAQSARSAADPLAGLFKNVADGAGEFGARLRDVFTGHRDRDRDGGTGGTGSGGGTGGSGGSGGTGSGGGTGGTGPGPGGGSGSGGRDGPGRGPAEPPEDEPPPGGPGA